MALTLEQQLQTLIDQYNSTPVYTAKTADQMRTQAEGEYQSYYDQLRLAAQQSQAQSDLALQQQAAGLQRTYDKQRQASAEQYRKAYSQADRQLLSRGMQRSSYAAQSLAYLANQGNKAQEDLWEAQGAAEGNIEAQRTQLAQQLAEKLSGYDANQAADVLNRIRQLEDQEYERSVQSQNTQNSLSAQIYQILYQQERDKIADEQWQKQFDESVRQFNQTHKSGGGGSSKKKATATTPTSKSTNPTDDSFKAAMGQNTSVGSPSAVSISGAVSGALAGVPGAVNTANAVNAVGTYMPNVKTGSSSGSLVSTKVTKK